MDHSVISNHLNMNTIWRKLKKVTGLHLDKPPLQHLSDLVFFTIDLNAKKNETAYTAAHSTWKAILTANPVLKKKT